MVPRYVTGIEMSEMVPQWYCSMVRKADPDPENGFMPRTYASTAQEYAADAADAGITRRKLPPTAVPGGMCGYNALQTLV